MPPLHMTATITPADNARVALKKAGFNARQVTTRQRNSTVQVTIRDPGVSLTKVRGIALAFWSVRYCEASGEALAGGNIYVQVEYADALVDPLKGEIVAQLEAAPEDAWVSLAGGFLRAQKVSLARRTHPAEAVRMWGRGIDTRSQFASNVPSAAERLAAAYLDACASGPDDRT